MKSLRAISYLLFLSLSLLYLPSSCIDPPESSVRPYIYLNGSNYLEIPHTSDASELSTGDFTIEGWFTAEKGMSDELYSLFMISNDRGENTLALYLDPELNNSWVLFLNHEYMRIKESSFDAADGEIHFVTFSYSRTDGNWILYLDNTQYYSGICLDCLDFQNSNILIGADYDKPNASVSNLWFGRIYEWRIWKEYSNSDLIIFKYEHPDKFTLHYTPDWGDYNFGIWRMNPDENLMIKDESPSSNHAWLRDYP